MADDVSRVSRVSCSLSASLDGYIVGPDGSFAWSEPDDDLFTYALDEVRANKVHFLGRRLYESMTYWDRPEAGGGSAPEAHQEFARVWRAMPKVVFSSTLDAVEGDNIELASGSVVDEVARWRAEPGDGLIAVGGATLLLEIAAAGLVDDYRVRWYPVLVGGGTPLFPREERHVDLELVSTRTFANGVVATHHRVVH